MEKKEFCEIILKNYLQHGRLFPWRETTDPYAICLSEIMLQQTQTDRVLPKYQNFLKELPNWQALAKVSTTDLLRLWQGLGYNRRALALKRLAEVVTQEYGGVLPAKYEQLIGLPGIGPYTAGAILAFAFNEPVVLIETNIRRVYLHYFFADKVGVTDKELLPIIQETLDITNPREWYYALMDYGAQLAKWLPNPNRRSAHYAKQSSFEGSNRQLRGKVLRLLARQPHYSKTRLQKELEEDPQRSESVLTQLAKEGFLAMDAEAVWLP